MKGKGESFFPKRHHHVCPQERKRTPKELRASRSVTTAKIHTQRPGRAKTVARERTPPLQRLHRTVCFARLLRTSRKTGRTYTPRKRNGEGSEGEPRREKGPEGGLLVYNATATIENSSFFYTIVFQRKINDSQISVYSCS